DIYFGAIKFVNEFVGFMVGSRNYGNSGIIWKNETGINTMGLKDGQLPMLQIYPNPVKDKLTIENPNSKVISAKIRNVSGKLFINQEILGKLFEIDFSYMPKG